MNLHKLYGEYTLDYASLKSPETTLHWAELAS